MDLRSELEILAWPALPIILVRVLARRFQHRLKFFAGLMSIASMGALLISFQMELEVYKYAMLVSLGMIFGTVDLWIMLRKQRAQQPWTRG